MDGTLKLFHRRPKYYCNGIPSIIPGLGAKIGLLEEIELKNIKNVVLERKKFDFYGEMTR